MKRPLPLALLALALFTSTLRAQPLPPQPEPLGIALENYPYPYPVSFLPLTADRHDLRLAYMDVKPTANANNRTVLLFHGKNFFGAYWEPTIRALTSAGYRVVVPDQVGFGKSSKPDAFHYSFHEMARHTALLLDHLKVDRVAAVGHSMGGMLAARFALSYPDRVTHLVLENPIGLEDYRETIPYAPLEQLYQSELNQTEDAIRAYHQTYYVTWRDDYDRYVQVHYRWTLSGDYPRLARVSALTAQMIYEQPVVHEFPRLRPKTLLVIGQQDRTAVGKARAPESVRGTLGNYPELGKRAASAIPNAKLLPLDNVGHTPHFESPDAFHAALLDFLK